MSMAETIFVLALVCAFALILGDKWRIFDYFKARFNINRCFFCLSFWFTFTVALFRYLRTIGLQWHTDVAVDYAIVVVGATVISTFFTNIIVAQDGRN
jgi:hypothetical protein